MVEQVWLVNRDGFAKGFEVERGMRHCRIQRPIKMMRLQEYDPLGSVTFDYLVFVRSHDRAPDGRPIFREEW